MLYLAFLFAHFCLCTLFFQLVQRPLFCIYNKRLCAVPITIRDIAAFSWHGLYTDVKVAGYMTAFPVLLVWAYTHFPAFDITGWLIVYEVVNAIVIALLCVADTALYRFWQFKIEASVLHYLRSIKGTFASVQASYIILAILAIVSIAALLMAALIALVNAFDLSAHPLMNLPWWGHLLVVVAALMVVAVIYCVIRGLHHHPDSPVYSYYCNIQFFNHCAVNPVYNFIYSIHVNDDIGSQFQAFDAGFCQERFASLYPTKGTPQIQLLNTDRPNILVIIWESLYDHFIESLGGKSGVTPNFDRLTEEGVYFTNCWAGSFRTDRGIVCILSGYLGMPTTSVVIHTKKLPSLPALPRTLRDKAGYETTAVHGGELKIFHKADYYWASGHDLLVEEKNFQRDDTDVRWGVQDGKVYEWLADDIAKKTQEGKRWFTTFQTLSSHEPFRVPYSRIPDNDVDNSFAYADEVFGQFVEQLKNTPAWKDLLIVVTGDHGLNVNEATASDRNSHIPLLLLGGAVRKPMKIDTLINQTDIAATLLGQMGLSHDDFIFSRDVLADSYTYPFALHSYNNGFIFRDATGVTYYDNVSQQALEGADAKREETAKVILQTLYTDFGKR